MSKRRVSRVRPVWKVFWNGLTGSNLLSEPVSNPGNQSLSLITQDEVLEMDDELVVKRIIGEIYFHFQGLDSEQEAAALDKWALHMGILVEDFQYDAETMIPASSVDAQDAPWAWLRTFHGFGSAPLHVREGGNVGSPGTDCGGLLSAHIDVKVARKLKGGDELRLKLSAFAAAGGGTATDWQLLTFVNLRILVES